MSCCKSEPELELIKFFKNCGNHTKEQIISVIKYQNDELTNKNLIESFNKQVDKHLSPIKENDFYGYCSSCSSLIDKMDKTDYKIIKDFILGFILVRRGVCEYKDKDILGISDAQATKSIVGNDFDLYSPLYFVFNKKLDRVCKNVFDEYENDDINNIKLEIYRLKK